MTQEQRRLALYVLPGLCAVAIVVGLIAHAFVIVAVVGAVVLGILYTGIARASSTPGGGRDRQRNRNRSRR